MAAYFEKFTGTIRHNIPSETIDKLLACLEQRGVSFVPITVSPGWEEFDRAIYDALFPVLEEYKEWLDEFTIPSTRDEGYYLIQLNKQQDEHSSPLKVVTRTIQDSKFPLCVIFFLQTIKNGWIKFERHNLKINIQSGYCVVFPANWTYQFEVDLGELEESESCPLITTFINF